MKTIEKYGNTHIIRVVNNPVAEELDDNRRFLRDVEGFLGIDIEVATNPKFPNASCQEVWDSRSYMAGQDGAPCTYELKKRARQWWERSNPCDYLVLGFTADEVGRYNRFVKQERENTLPILIDAGITKNDCYEIVNRWGIQLPESYRLGYPNANCVGCVKATSPTYWNHVRRTHPEVFAKRAETSRRIGARLVRVKGERIFLDELDPEAVGRPMASMDIECGIFCDMNREV